MQLVDVQRHTGDSMEFLDSAKSDLFPDEIFVFTPKGKIIDLRRNATALDFAYAIHTDIGSHTQTALVDKVEVPLSTQLLNGQTVRIITDPEVHPKPEWLEFVVTARARTAIRAYLKSLQHQDTVGLGLRLLEKALNARGSSLDDFPQSRWDQFLKENHLAASGGRVPGTGAGHYPCQYRSRQACPGITAHRRRRRQRRGADHRRLGRQRRQLRGLLPPASGDRIMAYVSADKGLVVHRVSCANVREFRKHPDRCVDVIWAPITQGMFRVAARFRPATRRRARQHFGQHRCCRQQHRESIHIRIQPGNFQHAVQHQRGKPRSHGTGHAPACAATATCCV